MMLLRAVTAEMRKLLTLPATGVAALVLLLGVVGIAVLNATGVRDDLAAGRLDQLGYTSPVEAAFSAMPLGTVGAVILGVIVISSEYTANSTDAGGGRQISTTLAAVQRRGVLILAKAVAVVVCVVVIGAIAVAAALVTATTIVGDLAPDGFDLEGTVARAAGALVYWVLMALIALGITVMTRSGIIPLILLIVNGSLVSVSFLLTRLTKLAFWLPDMAGMRLFMSSEDVWEGVADALEPVTGGVVMAAWAVLFLAVAIVVFRRRDA